MAAPILTAQGLNDLVADTLRDLGRGRFTEIATDLQEHTAMASLLRENRTELQSGTGVQWNVMVAQAGNFRNVGLAASDNINLADTMVQATADWRNSVGGYAIEGREVSMNMEPSQIVNLVKTRRIQGMLDIAEGMENNFWGPPVALTDTITPWGVNTWIVKNATEGFNGGVPSGYTTIGLNPTTYPRWNNWTAPYTSVSRDDLIRKWRKAARFTNFKPPVEGIPTFNTGTKYGYYTTNAVLQPLEETLQSQNDNLGTDVAKYDNMVTFGRVPVTWVPKLEADTTNPVYGINWGWFKTVILRGWWLRETHVPIYPGVHTMSAHFLDCTYQWVTKNRRCHFVLSNGTTYPS